MKKIFLFSLFLILGLIGSQTFPNLMPAEGYHDVKSGLDLLLYICLAFIMINVGREFELDKANWRGYSADYFIAMATAAAPWVLVCLYYMSLLPDGSFGNWDVWKENLILSRFAAPTSAGILFTMLAGAGLRNSWIYKKTHVLAIFDDLDTILLMIPLQIFMIGMKWQLIVVILVIFVLLYLGWTKLSKYNVNQTWGSILGYATILVAILKTIELTTSHIFGHDGAVHIEVLLPAFVLGMVINTKHIHSEREEKVSTGISYFFMFLVGMSSPLFLGVDFSEIGKESALAPVGNMDWGEITKHVLIVTMISNVGKMVPMFFYRDRSITERLALSIGMFTRGEVGAGVIFVAIGYNIGGPILAISLLSLVTNLLLTGIFVVIVKQLALVSVRR